MWKNIAKGACRGIKSSVCGGGEEAEADEDGRLVPSPQGGAHGGFEQEDLQHAPMGDREDRGFDEKSGEMLGKAGVVVTKKAGSAAATAGKFTGKFAKKLLQNEEGRRVVKGAVKDTAKGIMTARAENKRAGTEEDDGQPKRTMTGHVASSVVSGMMATAEGRHALRDVTRDTVDEWAKEHRSGGDRGEDEGGTIYGQLADGVLGSMMESEQGRAAVVQAAGMAGDKAHAGAKKEYSKEKASGGARVGGLFSGWGKKADSDAPTARAAPTTRWGDEEPRSVGAGQYASRHARHDPRFDGFDE